jgi:hypothetical protein
MTKIADQKEYEVMNMDALKSVETKIDNLLNCDYEPCFEINPLRDMPVRDGSLHYRISNGDNYVDFGVFGGEMAAYTWDCPKKVGYSLKH